MRVIYFWHPKNIGDLVSTNTMLVAPSYHFRMMGPKTLFILIIKAPILLVVLTRVMYFWRPNMDVSASFRDLESRVFGVRCLTRCFDLEMGVQGLGFKYMTSKMNKLRCEWPSYT